MRLLDTVLLSLSATAFIMGVHQIITIGFAQGYWLIMISSALFLWFSFRKRKGSSVDTHSSSSDKKKHRASSSHQAPSRRKKKSR